jgi:hypothetical protein
MNFENGFSLLEKIVSPLGAYQKACAIGQGAHSGVVRPELAIFPFPVEVPNCLTIGVGVHGRMTRGCYGDGVSKAIENATSPQVSREQAET